MHHGYPTFGYNACASRSAATPAGPWIRASQMYPAIVSGLATVVPDVQSDRYDRPGCNCDGAIGFNEESGRHLLGLRTHRRQRHWACSCGPLIAGETRVPVKTAISETFTCPATASPNGGQDSTESDDLRSLAHGEGCTGDQLLVRFTGPVHQAQCDFRRWHQGVSESLWAIMRR